MTSFIVGRSPKFNVFFELTDLLSCPRCGPTHTLVLLVKEVEDRRVMSGWLGCPSCRRDYPVANGVADLRLDSQVASAPLAPYEDDELALKIIALSGMAEARGYLMIGERLAHASEEMTRLAPGLEVVVMRKSVDESAETPGVSRIVSDVRFPLAEGRLRCVAVAPGGDRELVAAAVSRLATGGRLILFDASEGDLEEVKRSSLRVLAVDGGTALAERRLDSLPIVS